MQIQMQMQGHIWIWIWIQLPQFVIEKPGNMYFVHYIAFGRVLEHARYSCGVRESFAHKKNTILRTFKKYSTSRSDHNFV
jgi:hypothetical protein